MNPHQFLENLQKNPDLPQDEIKSMQFWTEEFRNQGKEALGLLTADEKSKIPEIDFYVLPILEGNAWSLKLAQGSIAIIIDNLFPVAIAAIARLIVEQFRAAEQNLPLEETYKTERLIWTISKYFVTRNTKYLELYNEIYNTLPPEDEYKQDWFLSIIRIQLQFIALHELQHVLCGHMEKTTKAAFNAQGLDDTLIEKYERKREQEFEADTCAVITIARDKNLIESGAYALCEVFPFFLHITEELNPAAIEETTHPKAIKRLSAIRETFDETTNNKAPKGLRRILDNLFSLNLEKYSDENISQTTWIEPDRWAELTRQYIDSVVQGKALANVGICGKISKATAEEIVSQACSFSQNEHLFNVGTLNDVNPETASKTETQDFIDFIIAVAIICSRFIFIRNEALQKNTWNTGYFLDGITKTMKMNEIKNIEVTEICDFYSDVLTDGKLCAIIAQSKNRDCEYKVEIIAGSATYAVWVK